MAIVTLRIDLAKSVFALRGVDQHGNGRLNVWLRKHTVTAKSNTRMQSQIKRARQVLTGESIRELLGTGLRQLRVEE